MCKAKDEGERCICKHVWDDHAPNGGGCGKCDCNEFVKAWCADCNSFVGDGKPCTQIHARFRSNFASNPACCVFTLKPTAPADGGEYKYGKDIQADWDRLDKMGGPVGSAVPSEYADDKAIPSCGFHDGKLMVAASDYRTLQAALAEKEKVSQDLYERNHLLEADVIRLTNQVKELGG